jgi:alpha-galactosidase
MRDALHAAGRPMVFSICEWGSNKPWDWARDIGHLWRTTGDIYACFDCKIDHGNWYQRGVLQILDEQKPLREFAGPGHWNDPDMLEVGNGLSAAENRAHCTMWCLLAAPLISGNDLRNMPAETLQTLSAKEVIAVDQDPLGIEGFVYATNTVEIWFKPLSHGDWAMGALNRGTNSATFTFDWKQEKVADGFSQRDAHFDTTTYQLENLWTQTGLGTTAAPLRAEVPGHDVLLLRLKAP